MNIAAHIAAETENVLLIEAEPTDQGSTKSVQFGGQNIDNGLRFFPNSPIGKKTIKNLEDFLGLKLIKGELDNEIETYEASGFRSFAGFGDKPPLFYEQVSYFLNNKEISLNLNWNQIAELLKQKYKGKILNQSIVTNFKVTDQKVTEIVVNGSKTFAAHNFIFTGNPRDLNQLLSDDVFGVRAKAKLKKDTAWVGLCLDLAHENVLIEKTNLFLLEGTTNDIMGPCIGRFLLNDSSDQKKIQISQWMSFIDLETSEETENIAELLKKVKRQIKRAFPEVVENIKSERLFITPPLSTGELKLNANGTMTKIDNLWIASAQMNKQPNLLGSLLQSQFVLSALGFSSTSEESHEIISESDKI